MDSDVPRRSSREPTNASGAAILGGVFSLVHGEQHRVDSHDSEPLAGGYGAGTIVTGNHGIGNEDVAARDHRDWCETGDFAGSRNTFLGSLGIGFSGLTLGLTLGRHDMLWQGAVSSQCNLWG